MKSIEEYVNELTNQDCFIDAVLDSDLESIEIYIFQLLTQFKEDLCNQ